jgi:hypothetical protein
VETADPQSFTTCRSHEIDRRSERQTRDGKGRPRARRLVTTDYGIPLIEECGEHLVAEPIAERAGKKTEEQTDCAAAQSGIGR